MRLFSQALFGVSVLGNLILPEWDINPVTCPIGSVLVTTQLNNVVHNNCWSENGQKLQSPSSLNNLQCSLQTFSIPLPGTGRQVNVELCSNRQIPSGLSQL